METILIYDDDERFCMQLKELLMALEESERFLVRTAVSYEQLMEILYSQCISILMLDIELEEGRSGIALAKTLQQRYPNMSLIYVTAHIRYCEEIFDTVPDAFLCKPINLERVQNALQYAKQKRQNNYLTLSVGRNAIHIPFAEIAYIERVGRNVIVYNIDRMVIGKYYGIRLDLIEERLPDSFLRCHQSILVNLDYVQHFHAYALILKNGQELPISQSRYKNAKKQYLNYLAVHL